MKSDRCCFSDSLTCDNVANNGEAYSFPLIDTSKGTNFVRTWQANQKLTKFPPLDFSNATNIVRCWDSCSLMENLSTTLNFNKVTTLEGAWVGCSAMTSFHNYSFAECTVFATAWYACYGLTEFKAIDCPKADTFQDAFYNCNQLVELPFLNGFSNARGFKSAFNRMSSMTAWKSGEFTKAENFLTCWTKCSNLTDFPSGSFDTTGTLLTNAFDGAWTDCALTAQSIENILVSLDTNGQSNIELGIDGGTNAAKSTWTAAANTAYTSLIAKGWTITFNA